jgi:hypothetical protein
MKNMLYDYDSIINIENDNYVSHEDMLYLYGDSSTGANIHIEKSTFNDLSTCLGFINYQEKRTSLEEYYKLQSGKFFS